MHPGLWHWANCVRRNGDLTAVTPGNKLCKFADDTYFIIPATNVDTRVTELEIKRHGPEKINMRRTAQNQIKLNSQTRSGDARSRNRIRRGNCTCHVNQDLGSHHDKQTICVRTWLWRHQFMCTDTIRATSHARPRYERFSAADNLSGRSWSSFVCVKCLRLEGFLRRSQRWGFCSQSLDSFEEL